MCGITAAQLMGLLMASFQSTPLEITETQIQSCCLAVVLQIEKAKGNSLQMVSHQEKVKFNTGISRLILDEYLYCIQKLTLFSYRYPAS